MLTYRSSTARRRPGPRGWVRAQLVVSTALPRIVGDLHGLSHLSWVVTAYVLASTITTPLYGKLGDLYGRKRLLVIAIVIFLAGSALSGMAQTMDQLIAYRALQGLGAGGLIVGAMATIGGASSSRTFFQQIGGSIGVSIFGVLFNSQLRSALHSRLPGVNLQASGGQLNPQLVQHLAAPVRDAVLYSISRGVDVVFWWAVPASVLVFLLALAVKEIPLRGRGEDAAAAGSPAAPEPELVV
jgi:MFS family permease